MKRYKLRRDLPTFKAGDIFYINENDNLIRESDNVPAYDWLTLKKFPNILTDWFEEIKEPLIKDEKNRKAFLAWAEVNDIPRNATTIEYQLYEYKGRTFSEFQYDNLHITFWTNVAPSAIHGKCYTINELCGEEV